MNFAATGSSGQVTSFVLLLPLLRQPEKEIKLLPAVCVLEVLGLLVADDFGFEIERKSTPLLLLFLDAF